MDRRENYQLRQRIEQLELESQILKAQQEVSLDGILVVDMDWRMLSFNPQFVKIWSIPKHILEKRDDRENIDWVLSKLKNPESFLSKIDYLMNQPEEESRDELELHDGRIIDRYSSPIFNPTHELLGRIWFFRDITEMKHARAKLKRQKGDLELLVDERTKELEEAKSILEINQLELQQRNTGLNHLLSSMENEKKNLQESMSSSIVGEVLPLVDMLKKSKLDSRQQHILDTIEKICHSVTNSFLYSTLTNSIVFTPTELKVANFIKAGKTTKEMATILNISPRTIEGHRLKIRNKLNLCQKDNLQTVLIHKLK